MTQGLFQKVFIHLVCSSLLLAGSCYAQKITLNELKRSGAIKEADLENIRIGLKSTSFKTIDGLLKQMKPPHIQNIYRGDVGKKIVQNRISKPKRSPERESKRKSAQLSMQQELLKRKPVTIPSCKESRSEKIKRSSNTKGKLISDRLYVSQHEELEHPEESFGLNVNVIRFSQTNKMQFLVDSVPCLPYRVRITSDKVSRYYGKNALRFYGDKE